MYVKFHFFNILQRLRKNYLDPRANATEKKSQCKGEHRKLRAGGLASETSCAQFSQHKVPLFFLHLLPFTPFAGKNLHLLLHIQKTNPRITLIAGYFIFILDEKDKKTHFYPYGKR